MRILLIFLAIGLFFYGNPVEADVYSWTDEDGVKRFSNKPPKGDIKDLKTVEEIPYDEEAAALRKIMEKEWEEERLAEEEKQYWENIQNQYMQDRRLLENRLRETERQVKLLEQELETSRDSDRRSTTYYPYWPAYPCWPNCGDKPDRPRPPYARPPHVNLHGAKPPSYREPHQMKKQDTSKRSQFRKSQHQRSQKTYRPMKSAPIASPAIR